MPAIQRITPCLWFDDRGEEAARLYCDIFLNSKIGAITRYGEAGKEIHGKQPGSVLTVDFELDGQKFTALNGGPMFKFSEAISLSVGCENQQEIDHYWDRLSAGGDPASQQCGWLKDQFGLSWQIVPNALSKMMSDPDPAKIDRMMGALLQMKKLDLSALERAFHG